MFLVDFIKKLLLKKKTDTVAGTEKSERHVQALSWTIKASLCRINGGKFLKLS